jgi:hypothetical protein
MGIHSKILIHWTGKDIENCPEPNKKSQLYVKRLKDDLEKGLFAKTTEEDVIRGWKIKKGGWSVSSSSQATHNGSSSRTHL